jgi:asparagine synthase (glutamine-hydrolysing)
MCGIAGVFGGGADIHRMTSSLAHRGPDDEGFFEDTLGFRRLSIIDLAGGAQPMKGCGDLRIVFNGEIYNFRELRSGLRNHAFRTQSDTEVILHLYEEKGPACVRELDGMFAFAIWDPVKRTLFAARDRLGKKPFVYRHDGERFQFASELAALEGPKTIDRRALEQYLAFGYIPAPLTIYEGVRKLPPGHTLFFDGKSVSTGAYWRPALEPVDGPEDELADRLKQALAAAVKKRLVADVPVGAFLSGGIDSSIVAGLMSGFQPTRTFSISFREEQFNEIGYAREAARRFKTDHREFEVTADAVAVLPLLVERFGEPFGDASAVPTYYVSRETSRHVKVALSGDGGDELFLGYRRYQAIARMASLKRWPAPMLAAGSVALKPWRTNYGERIRRMFAMSRAPLGELYADLVSIFTPPMRRALGMGAPVEDLISTPFASHPGDPMAAAGMADLVTYLPHDILAKVDIASMANGLEVRCPFLDRDVVDLALRLPAAARRDKGILRRAFRDLLPASILQRGKMGFGVPLTAWLRGNLRPMLEDAMATLGKRGLLDGAEIRRLTNEHLSGAADHRDRLWLLLVLELWHRRFLGR